MGNVSNPRNIRQAKNRVGWCLNPDQAGFGRNSGFDFGSVELEQELVAEADQYILDFIKSIRIDYSPETLAEIQRVRGDVTA